MDLKSLNRPTIPVRHNRRTQLKPLSRLNGDWLPQLKKIKTSEMSQQVRGHNASEELRTRRLVDQWFGEFAWQLGKLRKAQSGAMTDLARLHLERRQVKRHMLLWRQEDARQETERQKEREARREEMERVGQEIERRTRQLQREGRRMSMRLNAVLFPTDRRASKVLTNEYDSNKVCSESESSKVLSKLQLETDRRSNLSLNEANDNTTLKDKAVNVECHKPLEEGIEESTDKTTRPQRESSNPMLKAKVLEVTMKGPEPLVRMKTKSNLSDENLDDHNGARDQFDENENLTQNQNPSDTTVDPVDFVLNTNKVLPPISKSSENHMFPTYLLTPKQSRQNKKVDIYNVFPTIEEDKGIDEPNFHMTSPVTTNSTETMTPECIKISSEARKQPRVSVIANNRKRMKRRKEYEQAVLKEPYSVYRRDSNGRLNAMDHLPAPPKFEEPSNRESYRRSLLLRNERINFDDKMRSLESFTYNCIQEDIKLLRELQQPKSKSPEIKVRLDERFDEQKRLGPTDWMRVFIHSSLPKDIDPESHESLHHCRYIRKDEKYESNRSNQNRVTSWDHVE